MTRKHTKKPRAPQRAQGDICFVLMPFGGWLDDYYETIYTPAIKAAGLEPHRADDLFRPSTIVNDIWAYTKRSKLLLADLSGKNPNVFYELGLAHALAKPVILIAESMEEIPFDLRALRIIVYDKNAPDWGRLLRDKIASAIDEVQKSPVEAVLPAFLEIRSDSKPTVSAHEKEMIEIKQELDLLRREVRTRSQPFSSLFPQIRLEPDEARARIRDYLNGGMPRDMIITRLERQGVPKDWIMDEIEKVTSAARGLLLAQKGKPRARKP